MGNEVGGRGTDEVKGPRGTCLGSSTMVDVMKTDRMGSRNMDYHLFFVSLMTEKVG
jgi:hypothetical protein